MDRMDKLLDRIHKAQKYIQIFVIFLFFLAAGFKFDKDSTSWIWQGFPFIAILIVIIGLSLSLLWVKIEKYKTQNLINDILISSKSEPNVIIEKVGLLTNRQKLIFDLIVEGKSNKEILNELFIELSTLKTHINNIYKILKVDNRKEARVMGKVYRKEYLK